MAILRLHILSLNEEVKVMRVYGAILLQRALLLGAEYVKTVEVAEVLRKNTLSQGLI
jgi:hypothetical protein